jgi:hypothetical protein
MVVIGDTVDLNRKIENRSYTTGWLLESLRANDEIYKKLHGNRAVKEVTTSDVSGGKGFISIVCQCIIKFVDSDNDETDIYTTILKIPGFESLDEAQEKCESEQWFDDENKRSLTNMHELECRFYNELAPIFDVPLPKVYKVVEWIYKEKEGCIHMEDLTRRGKTISFFDNINLTQIKHFIRHLAHWHKNILSADPKIWKDKFNFEKIDAFKNALVAFDKMGENFLEKSSMKDRIEPFFQKYRKLALNIDFMIYASKEAMEEIGLTQKVIVHGDMHSGNIMFAIDENGDLQNEIAAFVDWQTMHEGSPMEDLARFLTLCADGVVRRQAEHFAVQYYYDCLVKEFGGDSSKIPYSVEQLQKAYNLSFICQGMFGLGITPFFMGSIEDREPSRAIKDSYKDYGTLKALHLYEDIDRLIESDQNLKAMFEKYGK